MNPYHKMKDLHESHLKGVGASEIPTLAGLNNRHGQTPLTLWQEKKGLRPPFEGNERTYWGNELQFNVLKRFISDRYGAEAGFDFLAAAIRGRSSGPFKVNTEAIHPERRYCLSHADLLVDGIEEARPLTPEEQDRMDTAVAEGKAGIFVNEPYVKAEPYLVEAKTSGLYSAKRREGVQFLGYDPDDRSQMGIPDPVFMQVQWQMYTYGVTEAWVVVLIDTADYREYGPIIYDPRHVEKSLALAEAFWSLVESNTEPTPATWGDVVSLYPDLENKTAMISGEAEMSARKIIEEGREAKERIKALEAKIEDGKMALGILAGDVKVVTEDGKPVLDADGKQVIKKTMNRVLNDSNGETLATFRDQTKDTLSLSDLLAPIRKKQAKRESLEKKRADGKTVTKEQWDETVLTQHEEDILFVEKGLREWGAYKTSEPFRVVNY